MSKELIVSATSLETKVAVVEEDQVTEIFIERAKSRGILGNIYKGKVTRVLPGMQSAFVDIGLERDAFLYVSDFVEDYEEYEKMFSDAEQAAEKLLKVEVKEDHIQPDEPRRRGGRGRGRSGRRGRGERPEHGGERHLQDRSPAAEETPRATVAERTSSPEPPGPPDASAGAPLAAKPEPASEPVEGRHSSWLDEVREAQAALEREAGRQSTETRSENQSPRDTRWDEDRDARVRGDREVDQFSLPDDDSAETAGEDSSTHSEFAKEESSSAESLQDEATSDSTAGIGTSVSKPAVNESAPSEASGIPEVQGPGTVTIDEPAPAEPDRRDRRRRNHHRPSRRRPRGKNQYHERHSIGDLLREGQEIIVQVAKEPIAKKGARITSHIALPGRFIVYMPTVDHVGVSRKIVSDKERGRLKEIVVRLRGESKRGFIVRTAGENCEEKDIRADMQYLTRLWDEIRQKGERMSAPAVIHSELDLVQRLLRDYISGDFKAVRVDDEAEYERIVEFINKLDPSMVSRVKLYMKARPIFDEYGINAEIERSLKPKVWLKTGGYIVINQTEALVAIDVNTGKFVGRGDSLEDTITRTNLDAVKEVVRQIRLRDLGGIIVIDFIDMDERRNRQKVMDALERELAHDKSPTKILQFNEFGLVAITRKRVKQSLERTLCQPCPYCNGSGMVKSHRTVCYSIHSEVKKMLPTLGDGDELMIRVNPEVARALREKEHVVLEEIQEMTGRDVSVKADPLVHFEQFDIVET
ncbi:MAG TPA: Rne/Rng family ribonuclease [Acidobacteriota bacterium]